jgi:tRNA(adenine34) deaminase
VSEPTPEDLTHLRHAVRMAEEAEARGDLPVGAVIVLEGAVVAEGRNALLSEGFQPGRHAETEALRRVPIELWPRAREMTCYTTLEPCPMCFGALLLHGVGRIVYGATDPEGGSRPMSAHLPEYFSDDRAGPSWGGPWLPETCDVLYLRCRTRFRALEGRPD